MSHARSGSNDPNGRAIQMSKSYAELLGEWVKRRDSNRREQNVVAFLAVRDDVKAALDAGFAVKTIWTNMHEHGRIAFGYDTFLIYVKRYIRRAEAKAAMVDNSIVQTHPLKRAAVAPSAPKQSPSKAPGPLPGFTFNSDPRKEDLL